MGGAAHALTQKCEAKLPPFVSSNGAVRILSGGADEARPDLIGRAEG